MNTVKFSAFSDLHAEREFNHNWKGRLEAILKRAKDENVDFVIHAGDFSTVPSDNNPKELEAVNIYNNFEIPTYHVLGNHDSDRATLKATVEAYKMPNEYYFFDKNGFRFIILNDNYCRIDGVDVPYEMGNYYKTPEYRDYISKTQLEWLKDTVMSSPYPMVILSHGCLVREKTQWGIQNKEDVLEIFRKAYKNGKRVLMCINGHLHVDFMRIYEHICYFSLNSATMHYLAEQHDFFPKEMTDGPLYNQKHTVVYNDPVHAIITLSEDGTIDIKGMESTFFMDVNCFKVTGRDDVAGFRITPNVLTEKIKLF